MMLNSTNLGNKIATARKKINFSQAELAQQVSISPQAVGKWERGESMPDISTLNRLAEIFGVDLNYFSDSFQNNGNSNTKQIDMPVENVGEVEKKRFAWNWDMSEGNWVDADFSGLKDLKDKLSSSNIKNCKFILSDLSGLTLKSNDIAHCDFSKSDLRNSKIQSSEIAKSNFGESSLMDAEFELCEMSHCNFNHANFSGTELINCNFQHNSLEGTIWKHSSFKNVGLSNITFEGKMEDCSFENSSFKNVKFQDATLLNTFFKHNRKLAQVQFINCQVDKLTYAFLKANGAKLEGVLVVE